MINTSKKCVFVRVHVITNSFNTYLTSNVSFDDDVVVVVFFFFFSFTTILAKHKIINIYFNDSEAFFKSNFMKNYYASQLRRDFGVYGKVDEVNVHNN